MGRYRGLVSTNFVRRQEGLFFKLNKYAKISGENHFILCAGWLQTNFTIETRMVVIVMTVGRLSGLNHEQTSTKHAR